MRQFVEHVNESLATLSNNEAIIMDEIKRNGSENLQKVLKVTLADFLSVAPTLTTTTTTTITEDNKTDDDDDETKIEQEQLVGTSSDKEEKKIDFPEAPPEADFAQVLEKKSHLEGGDADLTDEPTEIVFGHTDDDDDDDAENMTKDEEKKDEDVNDESEEEKTLENISEGDEENLEEEKDLGGEKEAEDDQIEKEQSSQNLLSALQSIALDVDKILDVEKKEIVEEMENIAEEKKKRRRRIPAHLFK